MSEVHKVWLAVVGLILLVGTLAFYRQHERHAGALALLTQQVESTRITQHVVTDSLNGVRQQAKQATAALLVAARVEVRKDSVQRLKTDSMVRVASAERVRAEQLLEDSLATISQLRQQVVRLVEVGRRDSALFATQQLTSIRAQAALARVIVGDSVAMHAGVLSYNSLLAEKMAGDQEIKLLKSQRPGVAGTALRLTAAVLAGYGAGRIHF